MVKPYAGMTWVDYPNKGGQYPRIRSRLDKPASDHQLELLERYQISHPRPITSRLAYRLIRRHQRRHRTGG